MTLDRAIPTITTPAARVIWRFAVLDFSFTMSDYSSSCRERDPVDLYEGVFHESE